MFLSPNMRQMYGECIDFSLFGRYPKKPDNYKNCIRNGKYRRTVAMLLSFVGCIPDKVWKHSPTLQDNEGNTVAMILAYKHLQIPDIWKHDSQFINQEGNTVAMIMAFNGVYDIQKHWIHSASQQNNDGYTVGLILLQQGKQIPKEWHYTPPKDRIIKVNQQDDYQTLCQLIDVVGTLCGIVNDALILLRKTKCYQLENILIKLGIDVEKYYDNNYDDINSSCLNFLLQYCIDFSE